MQQPLYNESYALHTSRETCNSGSCAIPANFCDNFALKAFLPLALTFPEPIKCVVQRHNPLDPTIDHSCADLPNQIDKSHPPISPLPFGKKKIVAHATSSVTTPSSKVFCMILTNSLHQCVTDYGSLDASFNHSLRSSALMPDGAPSLPLLKIRTACATYSYPGIPSSTAAGVTIMGTRIPSGGLHL